MSVSVPSRPADAAPAESSRVPPRRILFVGPLVEGGTSLQRCRTFRRLGHDVFAVDELPAPWSKVALTLPYRGVPPARRAPRPRGREPPAARAGRRAARRTWCGSRRDSPSSRPPCARCASAGRETVLLNYSGDDMFNPRNQSRQWRAGLPLYDLHVTTKRHNLSELRAAGARDVFHVDKAFDPLVHRPMPVTPEVRARLRRRGRLRRLARGRADAPRCSTWPATACRCGSGGPGAACARRTPNLRIEGRPLWSDDYASAVSAFRINLCFLRKVNRDRHTTRSVEIPACGGFMLAERTEEHLALFEEDREAVYFSSDDELLEKVRWYLAHEDERARIAEAGRRRCWAGGYTYERRLEDVLAHVAARGAGPAARRTRRARRGPDHGTHRLLLPRDVRVHPDRPRPAARAPRPHRRRVPLALAPAAAPAAARSRRTTS